MAIRSKPEKQIQESPSKLKEILTFYSDFVYLGIHFHFDSAYFI